MASIVDYLKSQQKDSSYAARQKLAAQYGIENYRGTAAQNTQLLGILKNSTSDKSTTSNKDTIGVADKTWEEQNKDKLNLVKNKFGLTRNPTKDEIKAYNDTGKWGSDLTTTKSTQVGEKDIYTSRDEYLSSYVGAIGESFDKSTAIQLEKYQTAQEDMDLSMDYYKKDFEKITSRKTQDYYKGIALQNKEFSKSLDYVSNVASKTIGALQGFGKNRIVEATGDKMESEARYKLDFSRGMENLATNKAREEARYKLNTGRLAKQKEQYESARDVEKKVGAIEATGDVTTYYDSLITGKTLSEDEAAARRRNITGGGTGVENILDY